ncbi:MAG TPA: membrane protein insertase YidC [Candidatus Acidoferrales bacterium]|nr:membrane protein insertase YidC [Candidatus Acidoferrales bacterium]
MEKRAFIAVVLSLLVLLGYQAWIARYYSAPAPPPASVKQEAEKTPLPAPSTATPASNELVKVPVSQGARDIRVETDNYVAVFTNQGARLKSFTFKHYRSTVNENSPPFEIVSSAPGVPFPLGVRWQGAAPNDDKDVLYGVEGNDLKLTGDAKGNLVFRGRAPNGDNITKSFTFTGSTYPVDLEIALKAADGSAPVPEVLLTDKSDQTVLNPDAHFEGVIALVDNKISREKPPDATKKGEDLSGEISWAGFGYTYFFLGLLPQDAPPQTVSVHSNGPALIATVSSPAAKPQGVGHYILFIGPKELDTLKSLGKGLERSIDFGYFSFISIPLLYLLHFSHRFTGSYGIDIILLTVLIKLLMAPLTHKSYVSMKQMQKLQPQMERLKEKFGDDKEKLNKEIMELYRRNGVNPLGGCLPMVLQFPVFIGLYNALSTPIELRHASFLWIKDLSQPDWKSLSFAAPGWWPSFLPAGIPVLTIMMGASMFLQQWMTPSAGDPNQRKMMMLMPLMFTFMFVRFPAGLTVYWLVNNLLTIGQQYWINRRM